MVKINAVFGINYFLKPHNNYISGHLVTAPYAGHDITMIRLFMNDGLSFSKSAHTNHNKENQ